MKFYQKKPIFYKKAFSLIEISVVIIIIGILIAGISNGIDLYQDYRLTSARNLTKNSVISRIPDLKLWLETTSEKAFKVGTTANISDYKNIALPNDQQDIGVWQEDVATKYPQEIASQLNDFKPSYVKNGIGGLPSLYFDGKSNLGGDFMSFDGSLLSVWEDGYTVFLVEKRASLGNPSFTPEYSILYQYILTSSANLIGYVDSSWVRIMAPVGQYIKGNVNNKLNENRIHCYYHNNKILSSLSKIFINKKAISLSSSDSALSRSIGSIASGQIARFSPGWTLSDYSGLISEIIIFGRPLSDKELENIHLYLSNKYKIKLE